ncbi:polysaccharide deacetylase family protein [filamentous cyanobacterium LEGE 11480]|uniref:Polysaccharide deacetylase family protein n=2 Tax=Romeriopsis TaxID=2992131 RepID=A0A928Z5W5_9CYAN|nr:polysaccharide deacetylase family protein [Romeriopsis navalis LEGE 11480]
MSKQPVASLSLDLDNQWSYMKTHGDEGWESYPTYLPLLVPRVIEALRDANLRITFFIVGQDAALEKNHAALRMITDAGHEVGNHSFRHEPWLHLYSEAELDREIEDAEVAIETATGKRPNCFRGPGFSLSRTVLKVLTKRGYVCDASTFPTFLGPLARMYYFMTSKLDKAELEQRDQLFGKMQDGLRPLKPYRIQTEVGSLIEIPVTTMPVLKIPIHVSYLLYLSVFAPWLAKLYFRFALAMCKLTGVQLSLLLHPLDFMGCDDNIPEMAFFPAMNLTVSRKLKFLRYVFRTLNQQFTIVPMQEHAKAIAEQAKAVPMKHPKAIALP